MIPTSRSCIALAALAATFSLASPAAAVSVPAGFVVENAVPATTFNLPVGLAFLPDGRFIVTEQAGIAWMVENGVRRATPVWSATNEILSNGDRGLLGVAVDPKYFANHYVYFLYTVDPDSNGTDNNAYGYGRLTRYTMRTSGDTNTVDPATRTILMGIDWRHGKLDAYDSHSIGSLRWGRDGSLIVSAGEGADYTQMDPGGLQPSAFGTNRSDPNEDIGAFRSQDITNLCGKILRINPLNGHGYAGNPYSDADLTSARSRVWAYGLRNPFRFAVRPGTGSTDTSAANPGALFVGDVGWGTWEELDVVTQAGQNFGWPCMEGFNPQASYQAATPAHNGCGSVGSATNPALWTAPVSVWNHTSSSLSVPPGITGIASVGGAFYVDSLYPSAYRGRYFFADYGGGWIRVATFSTANHAIDFATFGTGMDAPVAIERHPLDGNLYYVSITSGQVRRIRYTGPAGGNSTPIAYATATPASGAAPLQVAFSGADSFDPDGDPLTYSWTFGDGGSSTLPDPTHVYNGTGTFTATLTVNDGRGGQSQYQVPIGVGQSAAFPTTSVLDNFDRADGALGAPWVGTTGLAIAGNQLAHTCCYVTPAWGGTSFGPAQEAYVTISTLTAGAPEHDLMLKIQGTSYTAAHIEVRYDDALKHIAVATYTPSSGWHDYGVFPVTFVSGDQLGARAQANGTVAVFKNGALIDSVSVAGWQYATQGGSIGLTLDTQSLQTRLDDFGGGDWAPWSNAPVVNLLAPDGGESWVGGSSHPITWTATDDVAVTTVDLYYRDHASSPWTPIAIALPNTGTFTWFVHNTPSADVRVKVVAHDGNGNAGADSSGANFAITATPGGVVATTLRDFQMPGTQPFGIGGLGSPSTCNTCHSGYDPAVEPGHNFNGIMMGQAARDPLFYACLAVAEQDAPASGDLCIRCHAPAAWLAGNSQPTSGARIDAAGRESIACDFCHRLVDPIYVAGVNPVQDLDVLNAMLPAHRPTGYSSGQYVVDPDGRARGPFADAATPHQFLASSFHTRSEMCGTCHDVSNPVFERVGGARYAAGPLDTPAATIGSDVLLPLERTFSEWKNSAYPNGVYAPDFAGNAPGGIVSSCQDCHMRAVTGAGCNNSGVPVRVNLPLHDLTGGNAWMGGVIASLYPGETDAVALEDAALRAVATLQKAATLTLTVSAEADSFRAAVKIVNRTGHKLPTGYPEGRRMWLDVQARDAGGGLLYESCAYDTGTGVLAPRPEARVYEIQFGVSSAASPAFGMASGATFHFTLNDTVFKDNRIPPLGFTNAAYDAFGGKPVDPEGPAPRYVDGQNWDESSYPLPPGTATVTATLYYQTTSKEYAEFLKNTNVTNGAGQTLYDAWTAHGRSAPVAMATQSLPVHPVGVPEQEVPHTLSLHAGRNPYQGALELVLALPSAARVQLEIFDVSGRCVARPVTQRFGAGMHRLVWDGRDLGGRGTGAGVYWAVARVDDRRLVQRVVRLR